MRANPLSIMSDELIPSLMPDTPGAPHISSRADVAALPPDTEYDELAAFHGIEEKRLVLLHPGSHGAPPAWPAERYAALADQLAADGWQIAIVGDAPEPVRTGGVLGAMQTAALFLTGAVAPRVLPRLIAHARLLVADDAALAASSAAAPVATARALGTPHIVLAEHPRDATSDTITAHARALLSDAGGAHPGAPFTLHMPAAPQSA
ncbi:glycosyltransferase family 9 protein [Caballeronia sp. LZ035]|uniref:glycosyltransferase family 9 protein n=1 Tax=Caballeronia sp. LZ035 TaxID=3038568 RepID=UPI002861C47B|nr:glycosyltransferase family 9 protein [Caballeronia sp. LZ035]MDR5762033.1 glycosyltransferase family 9 protein [Caballeronia sp. LZ035]